MLASDFHICESHPETSQIYPGPRPIDGLNDPENFMLAFELLELCRTHTDDQFLLFHNGFFYRVQRDPGPIDGTYFRVRRIQEDAPRLQTLATPLPPYLPELLLNKELQRGGLILIVGGTGQGKTTTASAIVVSRLLKFGGFAYTIEDPPEMPLNGWHDSGYCSQTFVSRSAENQWQESIKDALRSQPAATKSILYIGEVRDQDCAKGLLRAASSGFLVVATAFGLDIQNGLQSLVQLTGDNSFALNDLANSLRLVIYQRIDGGQILVDSLVSESPLSTVAMRIRQNQIAQLKNDIEAQEAANRRGQPVSFKESR